jgi:hypothetical protein
MGKKLCGCLFFDFFFEEWFGLFKLFGMVGDRFFFGSEFFVIHGFLDECFED